MMMNSKPPITPPAMAPAREPPPVADVTGRTVPVELIEDVLLVPVVAPVEVALPAEDDVDAVERQEVSVPFVTKN